MSLKIQILNLFLVDYKNLWVLYYIKLSLNLNYHNISSYLNSYLLLLYDLLSFLYLIILLVDMLLMLKIHNLFFSFLKFLQRLMLLVVHVYIHCHIFFYILYLPNVLLLLRSELFRDNERNIRRNKNFNCIFCL